CGARLGTVPVPVAAWGGSGGGDDAPASVRGERPATGGLGSPQPGRGRAELGWAHPARPPGPAGRAHRALPRPLPLAGRDPLDLRHDGLRPPVELDLGWTVPVADRPLRSSLRGARRAPDPARLDGGGRGAAWGGSWGAGPR